MVDSTSVMALKGGPTLQLSRTGLKYSNTYRSAPDLIGPREPTYQDFLKLAG